MSDGVRITREAATELLVKIFKARDLPPDEALLVAEGLVWADLRGIESHGLFRIPQYMLRIDEGVVNPRPQMTIIKETAAAVVIDGDHSHGQIALNLASITYMIATGISASSMISLGYFYGKKNYADLKKSGYANFIIVSIMMGIFGVLFILFRKELPAFYIDDPDVIILGELFDIFTRRTYKQQLIKGHHFFYISF